MLIWDCAVKNDKKSQFRLVHSRSSLVEYQDIVYVFKTSQDSGGSRGSSSTLLKMRTILLNHSFPFSLEENTEVHSLLLVMDLYNKVRVLTIMRKSSCFTARPIKTF